MEDPTKLESSADGRGKGDENKTAISANTTGDIKSGDFVTGTVLASRYRIIGLVGKGGMGEVYKAEDIKLTQIVALKFLPDNFQNDTAALDRFHGEVRNARQVSHVNVCRVFDIGEVDGRHFLSMEFVDGDDLSSLLTRVGRLSSERAVEISRQLCVGMEAIHKAGILHRDLKPGNIIIDKKGVARITDFGIAGIEADMTGDNIRAGTPAYMSPEQITGKEVTTRSDIYSLGLVLYEIFTGKQPFVADNVPDLIKKHQTETPTNPSAHVKGIDPLVESVIAQCLEKDPKDRPKTALQVAMALPGGNPMQIALDAGQTPSPEMVAASPKKGALRPVVAVSLLAAVFVCIGLMMLMSKQTKLHRMVPLEKSPEVLSERSRELAEKFGYPSIDSYHGFSHQRDYLEYLKDNDKTPTRWQKLATGQPAIVKFWYRLSPEPLIPFSEGTVTINDPPNAISGMAQMRLDTKGRLIFFAGVPPRVDDGGGATREFDWAGVFKDAGFDLAEFQGAESKWTPRREFDERRAWTGKYPDQPDVAIRVEAAAYRGKLVSFEIVEPWSKPAGQTSYQRGINPSDIFLISILFGGLIVSAWLAMKNVRGGRSNVQGAFRITLFLFTLRMIVWAFQTHHVSSVIEVNLVLNGLQSGLFWACFAGLMYLAFEPYLRKHAPERVISWNRLLAGDWRDPLVGRDVLIGGAAGLIAIVLERLFDFIPIWLGEPPPVPAFIQNPPGSALLGIRGFPVLFLSQISEGLVLGFMASFLVLFFGLLLRRKWLGNAAVWLIFVAVGIAGTIAAGTIAEGGTLKMLIGIVLWMLGATWLVLTAARFGVLAMVSGFIFIRLFISYPVTTELSAWYAGDFILCVIFLAALAIYGFYTSTAGQKLWQGKLFDETG